jgi:hypothetical protein
MIVLSTPRDYCQTTAAFSADQQSREEILRGGIAGRETFSPSATVRVTHLLQAPVYALPQIVRNNSEFGCYALLPFAFRTRTSDAAVRTRNLNELRAAEVLSDAIGIDRLGPFLPLLKEIAGSAHFLLAVIALLNLLEVSPRAAHLHIIVAAGKSWLAAYADNKSFWTDQGTARRVCSLMEAILASDPKPFGLDQPLRKDIDALLGSLIRMGVAEAHRLEESLRLISKFPSRTNWEQVLASSAPHSLRVHYVQAASPVTVVTGSIDSRHSQRR